MAHMLQQLRKLSTLQFIAHEGKARLCDSHVRLKASLYVNSGREGAGCPSLEFDGSNVCGSREVWGGAQDSAAAFGGRVYRPSFAIRASWPSGIVDTIEGFGERGLVNFMRGHWSG